MGLIAYYEIKEATTLFELALWKSKIDQAEGDSTDRGAFRVEVHFAIPTAGGRNWDTIMQCPGWVVELIAY